MSKDDQQTIIALADENGIQASKHNGYSGRGMYGEQTFAVDVESVEDIGRLSELLSQKTGERRSFRRDNMGLGFIMY